MPIHDWTRVDAGLFHDFHQGWTVELRNVLNTGLLPSNYFALVEQRLPGPIADVLTLELSPQPGESEAAPPRTVLSRRTESEIYADRANRITVRHRHGKVVAVIEIVSPGNKSSQAAFRSFVEKSADLVQQGVHLLVVDLFPPGKRDPLGIHKAIWDEFLEEDLVLPAGKPLTLASYESSDCKTCYVNFAAVGEPLPEMPVFIRPGYYVPVPLEESYRSTWTHFPAPLKGLLED